MKPVYSLDGGRRQSQAPGSGARLWRWKSNPGAVYGPGTNAQPDVRRYRLAGGWEVLVGRSDADNDALSLKLARPEDYWFHVRGMPGSHVVLRCEAGVEPGRETLKTVAAIAAYFSKARGAGVVPVSCTRARFVTKPRGVKRGTVQIRRETVLKVRPELGQAVAEIPRSGPGQVNGRGGG